jgi:lipid II:glycine glycyltransferase (peptidoglycan interpeptide bridge formation enzyme)
MLEICTHRFLFLKRKEFWFYNSQRINKGTYNVFCYSNEKTAGEKKNVLIEQTSLITLEESLEELFKRINRTFKYHINKAEHIGITTKIDYSPTMQKCQQVMHEFSAFANKKTIAWNPKRIGALQKLNKLIISEAWLREERIVTHIYLHDTHRVVLLHSYHQQSFTNESLRGYANKLLHWKDILNFKTFGLKLYDFGGINMQQHPGISKFKLSFGGELIDTYSYIEASPLASAMELYKRIRN